MSISVYRFLSLSCFSFAVALSPASTPAHAGAFNQAEGAGQIIVATTFADAGQTYDVNGRVASAARFTKLETTALIEYGLTDWLTLLAKPALLSTNKSGPGGSNYHGLGSTELGAQVRLFKYESSVVAVQATVRIPGAPDSANIAVPRDNTRVEQDLRLMLGQSFQSGSWSSFADAQIGYRWRHGGPPGE